MKTIVKYPRTPHIESSRRQPGDEDLSDEGIEALLNSNLTIEEKVDGANAAISFVGENMRLQSRGHLLMGGFRERHFNLFKRWAIYHTRMLKILLGERYIMYGEWLYAKHTIFYDSLPHYFLEFDILDLERGQFLDTDSRHQMLQGTPIISVPVLAKKQGSAVNELSALIGPSRFKSKNWRDALVIAASKGESAQFGNPDRAVQQTDLSEEAEGLYIKIENESCVKGRFKFVRPDFSGVVLNADSHWLTRPITTNGLHAGADIFATP